MIAKIDSFLEKVIGHALVINVLSMLLLSVLGIVLRWFQISFPWIDPLVRHLVFLSAFLGGALASGKGRHIAIDIISKYLESVNNHKTLKMIKALTIFVSVFTCFWLIDASIEFAKSEFEYGKANFFGIHSGYLVSIIPFGFGLIVIRFIFGLLMIGNSSPEVEEA